MRGPGASRPAARVLVVEDDPEIRYLLSVILAGDGREVLLAETGEGARAHLAAQDVSLMVLDLLLPDVDGRTLLQEVRANAATATLPVIVITSRGGKDLRAECHELGADAFIEKPFDMEVLASDVARRLERAAALEREAHQDDLTGLLNLAGFHDAYGSGPAPLLVVEIDGIRDVSERFGWGTAEMVVAELGKALRARLPPLAALARTSGGEFGAVLVGTGSEEAREVAQAALEAVRVKSVRGPDGEPFRLTASAGLLPSPAGSDSVALLDEVRGLVRGAQAAGGNRLGLAETAEAPVGADAPILVAEDDDITAKILEHRLTKEGFRVVRFDNGQDAYLGALEQTPCMVLLDVKMPGMDGFEVLQRLRKTPSYATVPIMMLTSMGSEADVVRGFQLGADDYMLKPFSPAELLARLRRLLRRGHAPAGF